MIRTTPAFVALTVIAAAIATPAAAQMGGFVDPAAIDYAVAGFTGAALGETGGALAPVDRRLRLAACASPLALAWRMPRQDAVVVTCADSGWHVFVPVRAAASAAIAVARGESVTIAVTGENFTVSQPGEAIEAGAVGEWIRVRTVKDGAARGEAMRAQIVRPGEVAVPLP